jgi:hypothetical protein
MSRSLSIIACLILTIFLISCDSDKPPTQENTEINAFLENYYRTFSQRDWEAYKDFFIDEAILTTIWQSEEDSVPVIFTNTISQFIEQTGAGPDSQPIFEERMVSSEIKVQNGLASAWVAYKAKFGSEENLMEWSGLDLFSLIKHENRWYIASLTYVSDE